MDKFLLDRGTEVREYTGSTNTHKRIRFPTCLEVEYYKGRQRRCCDFTLCLSVGGLFINSEEPCKVGDRIQMIFCIPPHIKSLGEFDGEIMNVSVDDPNYPRGIFVKFINCGEKELDKLEDLIEERAHLIDNII